jgi:branched-chain amino acid transport system ATP-binding protein
MSVEDNLLLGAFHLRRRRALIRMTLDEVYERFPALRDRRTADAGTLSGGEAQLLAVGRALMGRPKLIILDEPSLGLAPRMVSRVFSTLRQLATQGVGVLLAEQNAKFALAYSQQGYVLERGRVSMHAEAQTLVAHPEFVSSYLGGVEE